MGVGVSCFLFLVFICFHTCDIFYISPPFNINYLKFFEDIFGAPTIHHIKHISALNFHSLPPSYFTDGGVREQHKRLIYLLTQGPQWIENGAGLEVLRCLLPHGF